MDVVLLSHQDRTHLLRLPAKQNTEEQSGFSAAGSGAFLSLEADAVEGLFGTIAANSHAAPSAGWPAGRIEEEKRAGRSFARFHTRKVLGRNELCDRLSNRQEQGVRRAPAAQRAPFEAGFADLSVVLASSGDYCSVCVIALEYPVERRKFSQRASSQRTSPMLNDKSAKPLP